MAMNKVFAVKVSLLNYVFARDCNHFLLFKRH